MGASTDLSTDNADTGPVPVLGPGSGLAVSYDRPGTHHRPGTHDQPSTGDAHPVAMHPDAGPPTDGQPDPSQPHPGPGPGPGQADPGEPDPGPSGPGPSGPGPQRRHQSGPDTDPLLQRLAVLPEGDPERAHLRDTIVTSHLPLVHHIARRFAGRGEPHDDVVQVGTIGLIKAVDRYEPGRGVPFAGYAVPTVTGEIRRYFRDRAGTVRLPRRVQEVQVAVTQSRESLTHELGRTPTVEEVSRRSGLDSDTVLEVLESAYSLTTVPLDVDNGVSDSLGEEDVALDEVLTRETLRPVLAKLEPRERRIIALRFVRGMSQAQIADEVGISQMHVSRLLSRTLARLRADMTRPDTST